MPCSAVGRSENPGGGGEARSNVVGIIYSLVEIGLIGLPKTGGGAPLLRQPCCCSALRAPVPGRPV